MPIVTEERMIGNLKFKLRSLTWLGQVTLMDEGFKVKRYMELCILEPQNFDLDLLDREQGTELLKAIDDVNKKAKGDIKDFQISSQTQEKL